ncbi:NAD(P)H-dependent oxidoreductase [Belliella sp. R4-6]|uniref:NAD(P)H-dependent oxidoreductase n=1 Tax=Belliella alkalica TaxID=1730871 RepID=A0ABS9VEV4_9BACT|nr:NAD(P)H-dependent oxidoreductase [Belliella alkalica]MCH7414980.1 NAD(P)H-dependent oxidoreductase [Belliella alkalica]
MKYSKLKVFVFFIVLLTSIELSFGQSSPTILIAYYSESGKTQSMAEAVAKGVDEIEKVDFILKPISEVKIDEVLNASAIILGSPVYNGNVAPEIQEFINSWPFEGRPLKDKIGAVFVTGGGFSIGEEAVMMSMIRSMMIHGLIIVGGDSVESAFGASAITGEGDFDGGEIQDIFLKKAVGLGRRISATVVDRSK